MILKEFGPIQQAAARGQNQNNSGNNSKLSWLLFGIIGCLIGYRISQGQKNNKPLEPEVPAVPDEPLEPSN